MNLKHLITLATLALLSLGGLGKLAAQSQTQVHSPMIPNQESATNRTGCATVPVGEPHGADTATKVNDGEDEQDASSANTEADKEQERQAATPAVQPVITAAAAQQTAEVYLKTGCASQVALDDENGQLSYTIQIGNTEVKVNAMTGVVLGTENAED